MLFRGVSRQTNFWIWMCFTRACELYYLDEMALSQSQFVPAAACYWKGLQAAELLAQSPRVNCRYCQCHHWLQSTPIFFRGQGWPGQPDHLGFPPHRTCSGIFPSHCGTGLSVIMMCHCDLEWRVPFISLLNTTLLHITLQHLGLPSFCLAHTADGILYI